jgi:spore maturation protein CgeB
VQRAGSIVMGAEFWFGATGAGLAHGFRQLGWDVSEVDLRDHLVTGRTRALRIAARALHGECRASYNRTVLEAVDALNPRAFLTVKGSLLSPQTLEAVRRRGVTTVNYYPDFHFDYAALDPATFPLYDLFFTTKSFQVEHLRARLGADRVRFLHHGFSSLVHRPRLETVAEEDFVADVLYVGNHSSYKERWLAALAKGLPGVRLTVLGHGWATSLSELAGIVKGPALVGDSYARILQRARINLAIHSGPHGPTNWKDRVSTRTFEIPACRGFMLHVDNDEVRGLFEPAAEIDVFSSDEELRQKIVHYLAHPEQRAHMIERAFKRCVPAYSYDERAGAIAEALEAI